MGKLHSALALTLDAYCVKNEKVWSSMCVGAHGSRCGVAQTEPMQSWGKCFGFMCRMRWAALCGSSGWPGELWLPRGLSGTAEPLWQRRRRAKGLKGAIENSDTNKGFHVFVWTGSLTEVEKVRNYRSEGHALVYILPFVIFNLHTWKMFSWILL